MNGAAKDACRGAEPMDAPGGRSVARGLSLLWCVSGLTVACNGADAPEPSDTRSDPVGGTTQEIARATLRQLRELPSSPITVDDPLLGRCRLAMDRTLGDRESFGQVTRIRQLDSLLFVTDYRLPPHLKVVDARTGEIVQAYGTAGEGPGEFRTATAVFVRSTAPATVGVYDYQNRRVSYLRFEGRNFDPRLIDVVSSTNDEMGLLGLAPYDDGFVAGGLFGDFSLAVIDREGRITGKLVTDPPFGPEDIAGRWGFAAIMNKVHFAGADEHHVVLAYEEESLVDLVDLEAGSYLRIRGPEPVKTEYVIRQGRLDTKDSNERAYRAVAASRRLVFAGFLGGRVQDMPFGDRPHRIVVFDWDGRYLAELDLGRGITSLGVSPDGSRLWAGYQDPYPRIGSWPIPEAIREAGAADGSARLNEGGIRLSREPACQG